MAKVRAEESFDFLDPKVSVIAQDTSDGRIISAVMLDCFTVQIQRTVLNPRQIIATFSGLEEHYFTALKIIERLKSILHRKQTLAVAVLELKRQWPTR